MAIHGKIGDDSYLTPPDLVKALGPFNMDPCCPSTMPWRTARNMRTNTPRGKGNYDKYELPIFGDGLTIPWRGRVWLNPPYSDASPWIDKFIECKSGIALVSAKSTDTIWGQKLLSHCHSALWLAGRIRFYRQDGTRTKGKFLSNLLVALAPTDTNKLIDLVYYSGLGYRGKIMIPLKDRL